MMRPRLVLLVGVVVFRLCSAESRPQDLAPPNSVDLAEAAARASESRLDRARRMFDQDGPASAEGSERARPRLVTNPTNRARQDMETNPMNRFSPRRHSTPCCSHTDYLVTRRKPH